MDMNSLLEGNALLNDIKDQKEVVWINPDKTDFDSACIDAELSMKDIDDAEARLQRFAPFSCSSCSVLSGLASPACPRLVRRNVLLYNDEHDELVSASYYYFV